MKPSLQLKLSQQLTLTPQLQQSIRLLQLSTLDLNQEIEKFLLENPLLERTEEFDDGSTIEPASRQDQDQQQDHGADGSAEITDAPPSSDEMAGGDDWEGEGSYGAPRPEDDESDAQSLMVAEPSLRDHLEDQLRLTALDTRDRALVSLLIDSLDEDGLLSCELDELLDAIPDELEVGLDDLSIALRLLQTFDPPGVGARNVQECLLLQLAALDDASDDARRAIRLVRDHLDLLAAKDYTRLKRLLHCSDDELKRAQEWVQRLNPRPGGGFGVSDTRYVIADVLVRQIKGVWTASLNPAAMPRLRINQMYADILGRSREGTGELSAQLQEAKWLIKNVQQRFETILKVSQEIVDRQARFFEYGEVAMRPLVLRDIADAVGLHESTISRVTTQKFMQTPRGIFELKYFFGSHVDTDTGGECSAIAIRALIKQLISSEDQKKPLSDSLISEMLAKQGIVVARRTVAKYREAMHIPPVSQRKSL